MLRHFCDKNISLMKTAQQSITHLSTGGSLGFNFGQAASALDQPTSFATLLGVHIPLRDVLDVWNATGGRVPAEGTSDQVLLAQLQEKALRAWNGKYAASPDRLACEDVIIQDPQTVRSIRDVLAIVFVILLQRVRTLASYFLQRAYIEAIASPNAEDKTPNEVLTRVNLTKKV